MCIVYRFKNKLNGKVYVGRTKLELNKRVQNHLLQVNADSKFHFHNALRKWGIHNFDILVLEDELSTIESKEREVYWISYFNSFKKGYNMTVGGEGKDGYITPQETKDKIRKTLTKKNSEGESIASIRYKKRHKTLLRKDKDYLKTIGKKSSETQKKNNKNRKNVHEREVLVFNKEEELLYTFNSVVEMKRELATIGLPTRVLEQSYRRGGEPIYCKTTTPKRLQESEFKGYYAILKLDYENNNNK